MNYAFAIDGYADKIGLKVSVIIIRGPDRNPAPFYFPISYEKNLLTVVCISLLFTPLQNKNTVLIYTYLIRLANGIFHHVNGCLRLLNHTFRHKALHYTVIKNFSINKSLKTF